MELYALKKRVWNEILPGWKNVIWKNPETERLAYERIAICLECDKLGKGTLFDRCGECGCPIKAKARSPQSHCPLKKW